MKGELSESSADDARSWTTSTSLEREDCPVSGSRSKSDKAVAASSSLHPGSAAEDKTPSAGLPVRRRRDLELYVPGVERSVQPSALGPRSRRGLPSSATTPAVTFDRQIVSHSDHDATVHSDVEGVRGQSVDAAKPSQLLCRPVLREDAWSWDEEELDQTERGRTGRAELGTIGKNNSNSCSEAVAMMLHRLYGEDDQSPTRRQPDDKDRCWDMYSDRYRSKYRDQQRELVPYSELVVEWQKRAFEFVTDKCLLNDGDQVIRLDGRDGGGTLLYDLASCRYRSASVSPFGAAASGGPRTKTNSPPAPRRTAAHARPAGALRRRRQAVRHLGYLAAASARCRSVDSAIQRHRDDGDEGSARGRAESSRQRQRRSHSQGRGGRGAGAASASFTTCSQTDVASRQTASPQESTFTESTDGSWCATDEEDWLLRQILEALDGQERQVRVDPDIDDVQLFQLIDDELSGKPSTDLHRRPDDYVNDYVSRLGRFISNMDYFLES